MLPCKPHHSEFTESSWCYRQLCHITRSYSNLCKRQQQHGNKLQKWFKTTNVMTNCWLVHTLDNLRDFTDNWPQRIHTIYIYIYTHTHTMPLCFLSTYNGALAHERFTIQMRKFEQRLGLKPTTLKILSWCSYMWAFGDSRVNAIVCVCVCVCSFVYTGTLLCMLACTYIHILIFKYSLFKKQHNYFFSIN